MAEIKLTKTELRSQQIRLNQLHKYLPTLQLKKALLQAQILDARQEIKEAESLFFSLVDSCKENETLLDEPLFLDLHTLSSPSKVDKKYENIAGVEVPYLEEISFEKLSYSFYDTPLWLEALLELMRKTSIAKTKLDIAEEKCLALEEELRSVSTRVNLFEKVLIPRTNATIRKIRIFLGDQDLAAVCRAKVAKKKIIERQAHKSSLDREEVDNAD